ncbi:hypothetical protein P1P91_10895 [Halomonas piscis]|uniref:Uncharacterized protein n=1 Tax=Halomonas piscis TaxID=3031727 RepID=A0ABY9YWV2_9GAMM|nr:hypothetical protein [Halomonas piscis]WNK19359.1 hypothetical protein P1P91_10895 [Halomonas piscis]
MKPNNEKSPALAATSGEAQGNASDTHHSSRCPTFPTSEHGRAVLGCLLTGGKVDQYSYYQTTGHPLVDFRTRVSELSRDHYWPIDGEFHETQDFNGEPRRVKRYWLDRAELLALFERCPSLKHRCEVFSDKFRQEGKA